MNRDNHLIFEAFNQSQGTAQIQKQVKMLINNAIRNVFAVFETLDNVDNIPYDSELHSLIVNLDEEVGRLLGTLEDEKMPQHSGKEENAESGIQNYIYLDLYTGKTSILPKGDFEEAIQGLDKVRGKITVYKGEEYMVLVIPAARAENSEETTQLPNSAGNSLQSKNTKV